MPEVTYLVKLNIPELSQIADIAGDIEEDLTSSGHDVVSVAPWARPSALPTNPLTLPIVPNVPPEPPLV